MSGKGSSPRPYSVPKESFDESFDRIFGRKLTKNECDRYEILESEHMGDPDKRTGIYAKEKADVSDTGRTEDADWI